MGIWRVSTTGGTKVALNSTPLVVVGTQGDAYYNKGNAQTLAYACTQNNVIDTTQYQYVFAWTEQIGALPGNPPTLNLFHSLQLRYTSIVDQRFP